MFIKFPHVEGFHNLVKNREYLVRTYGNVITYRGRIKLHGTNAGIRINADGTVFAQSRSTIITVENDNAGFAKWVDDNREFFAGNAEDSDIIIYGEWAGPGVQKNTAVNMIEKRMFFPFACYVIADDYMDIYPDNLDNLITKHPDIHMIPWETNLIQIDFSNVDNLTVITDELNSLIEKIEQEDPFIKKAFNVEGIGEGLVFVPIAMTDLTREAYSNLTFKAKGEKHRVSKQKNAVQIDPEVAKNIEDFVHMVVTSQRLEQGFDAVGEATAKNIGPFLKWMGNDIRREAEDELEASNLDWSDVAKPINIAALAWFKAKIEVIK